MIQNDNQKYIYSNQIDKTYLDKLYSLVEYKDYKFLLNLLENQNDIKLNMYDKLHKFYICEETLDNEFIIDIMLIINKKRCYKKNIYHIKNNEVKRGKN